MSETATAEAPEPVWLSVEQVCDRVPDATSELLAELRRDRRGPAYYKPNLTEVLYLETEIQEWLYFVAATGVAS